MAHIEAGFREEELSYRLHYYGIMSFLSQWVIANFVWSLPLEPFSTMDTSQITHRLNYKIKDKDKVCSGFYVRSSERVYFLTAAHCHLNEKFRRTHRAFQLDYPGKRISIENTRIDVCNDVAFQEHKIINARIKIHDVSDEPLAKNQSLVVYGYPTRVVGRQKRKGVKLSCIYEGTTSLEPSKTWPVKSFRHQMICNFPYDPSLPNLEDHKMGGISGGPVFNEQGEVVGLTNSQRLSCPEYAQNKDGCRHIRLMFTQARFSEKLNQVYIGPEPGVWYSNHLSPDFHQNWEEVYPHVDQKKCLTGFYSRGQLREVPQRPELVN